MEALQSVLNDALVRGSVKRGLREYVLPLPAHAVYWRARGPCAHHTGLCVPWTARLPVSAASPLTAMRPATCSW